MASHWVTEMQAPMNTPSSLPSYPTMPPMSGTTADARPGNVPCHGQPSPVDPETSTRPSTSPSYSLNPSLADAAVDRGSSPQQSLPVGGAGVNLPLRVQYLESLCVTLQKEKRGMEEEFGRQRKKFMNHMVEMEAEATLTKKTMEKLSNEVRELSTQLLNRDEEIKNIAMAAQLTEAGTREAFDADRVKYEEELASLRQILKVQSREHQAHAQEARQQEKLQWGGAGPEPSSVTPRPSLSSPDPSDSLETSMMKAAADTRVLRAVVVPLEEEIDMLRMQLKEAQQRLQYYEGKSAASSELSLIDFDASPPTVDTPTSKPSQGVLSPSPTEGNKLMVQHQLELERAARHDLEMHTEQLKSQKAVLQEEMSALQRQLEQVRTELEMERLANVELKKTWELANQHFIVAQNKLQQDVYHLEQRISYGSTPSPAHEGGEDSTDGHTPPLRAHQRSQSSDTIDVTGSLGVSASLGKAASWSSLQPGGVAGGEANEELQKKVSTLEEELTRMRQELSRSSAMCVSYESQLQRVQEQMVADLEDKDRTVDRLRAEMEKYKAGITRERKLRQSLRRQLEETREEMKTRIDTFQGHEHRMAQSMKGLRESFTEAKHDAQREVARFSDERVRLYQQIEATKEEYDCLKTLQTQQMNEYKQQLAESQRLRQESDQSVLATVGELDNLRGKMVEAEDQLSNQVVLLREQVASEQLEKDRLRASLSAQLESAQQRTAELQTLQETLDREQAAKEEVLLSKASIQEKSKAFIQEQQQKLEQLSWEKATMAQQVGELQHQVTDLLRQVASLKSQLNHTEATQKDFVQLSQSLQMQLAQIEEQRQLELSSSQEATPT